MIARLRRLSKAAVLVALSFPQLVAAQTNDIGQRQIDTMGLPPAERVEIICEGRETSNLCQKLIDEPDYRDLWLDTADKLTRAEWALAEMAVKAQGRLDQENAAIRQMTERAPKLTDGRAIFRAQDGRYFDADGTLVSPEEAATAR